MTMPKSVEEAYVYDGNGGKMLIKPGDSVELLPANPDNAYKEKEGVYTTEANHNFLRGYLGQGPFTINWIGSWPCGRIMLYVNTVTSSGAGVHASDCKGVKKHQPYIGVTGFMSADEVSEVLKAIPNGTQRKLMVGVLASGKTIRRIPNKWPNRYPAPENIAGIFPDHPLALNLVHFNTKEPDQLLSQMLEVTELGGENFHGFQLNLRWPQPYILNEYKNQHPNKILVLQCGSGAMEAVENDPHKLAKTALLYEGICEYLLIDPSGGLGMPLDSQKGLAYLQCLNNSMRIMKFGIAGGLSSETLGLLETIAETFPDTSIDAEGKLRDEDDHLDPRKANEFVSQSYALFSRYGK